MHIVLLCLLALVETGLCQNSRSISDEEIDELFRNIKGDIDERKKLEMKLSQEGKVITKKQKISDTSLNRERRTDPNVYNKEYAHLPFEIVTYKLDKKYRLSDEELNSQLPRRQLRGENAIREQNECNDTATENTNCDATNRYRTLDGTCNNLDNPLWGSAFSCLRRLRYPHYQGADGFRQSVDGGPLPEPRTLSLNVHNNLNRPTDYINHLFMFFGQLLDHDITLTPVSTTVNNEAIECCGIEGEIHPQCAPILIPRNDPFYARNNVSCLNFVRSAICPTCTLGRRNQVNQVTAFVDASFVYGNSQNITNQLRTNDGTGRMRVTETPYGDILMQSLDPENDQCSLPQQNQICFQAGDPRVNQHTTLASLHTLFVLEHNRLADGLRRVNPNWDEETLFQEARRIVGAEMQVITYKEFLPVAIGERSMSKYGLRINNRGSTTYNCRKNPTLYSEFTTAAFRFGHSLINSLIANSNLNNSFGIRFLRDDFFEPFTLYNGVMSPILRAVSRSPAQWFDRHVTSDVTNFLYRIRGNATGLDLASFNIQRGRDHGIPPYTEFIRYCSSGDVVINNFDDLLRYEVMDRQNVRLLQQNYRSVHDVDLWTGILSERYSYGAVVGPTAICIIGRQFNNLKYGDRFYFEHRNQRGSFTPAQMQEVRRISLSTIICQNTNINEMPERAMLYASNYNHMVYCNDLRGPDLWLWKEE